ncbi:hypothetical protein G7Y89_g11313 [Cudoniella acicularis]|uniref:Major facilitator superfamily (MFS) profile domain-containing protein n=1 Tax=Cudoniella acicularis TaxID=354080 RepID=A0A8H4RB34_9HELO|nr:hypothetical protein G7Y89_g11313 [Cudoniella acicularis]
MALTHQNSNSPESEVPGTGIEAPSSSTITEQYDPSSSEQNIETKPETPKEEEISSENTVDFDGPSDLTKPTNWPLGKKIITTVLYGMTTGGSTWASSVYTSAGDSIAEEFGIGSVVSTLGLTLFLLGFGIGPLLWGPLSEAYGRKIAVLPQYFIAACFCFGTAAAKDIQTVMITRFFTGFFGSAPVTNTGGKTPSHFLERKLTAILGYSMSVVGGPMLAPLAGAAIIQNSASWRWVFYMTGILMMTIFFFAVLLVDESSAPIILTNKAARLRRETNNWALHSKHEEIGVDFDRLFKKYLIRPWQLLATPICFFMVLYASFVYGIVYLNFAAFAIEFQSARGWSQVITSLPFIAIFIGCFFSGLFIIYNQQYYSAQFKANGNKPVPEARLRSMMIGGIVMVMALFVFAWTSDPRISWVGPCIGALMMGFGFFSIFQASTNYLVDTFQTYAASALAANTLMRNIFAATFPLFTSQMYEKLGIDWAGSLLGFVALAMVPIPFIFSIYGKRIRARGEWSKGSTL